MASRQTRGELTEQLGCPGRNDEHAHGVGRGAGGGVDLGTPARFYQIINCVRIDMSTGMGTGDLNKDRLSGSPASDIRRDGVLPQRRGLKQHAAGIKCRGKLLAHRRLLAGKQHDDLSPIVRHGRQQLEQAVRKRRDTAHAYGAGARRQVIGQGTGHNVGRLAGLDHISTIQTARVGAQKLEHASLGIAFGSGWQLSPRHRSAPVPATPGNTSRAMRASMRTVPWLRESGCRSASSRRVTMSENSIWRCRLSTKPRPSPKSSQSERSHDVGVL